MKKKIILIVVGILALAASVFAIVKFSSNNDNNEIIEEQNQEVAVPLFYGESTVPVLSNVPTDISFNIVLVEGAQADYELLDENARTANELIEITETGYTIKAPKDGYEKGQTYHLVLSENNIFEAEEYASYQALDFVIDRQSENSYTYSENVKEDNELVVLDDNKVDLSNTKYNVGDIILTQNDTTSKAMKIIAIDGNGVADYVTPSIIELFDDLDLHESAAVIPSEEYINALNETLNNDESVMNAIVDLFFEEIKAEEPDANKNQISPSIKITYDVSTQEFVFEVSAKIKLKSADKKDAESTNESPELKFSLKLTLKNNIDYDVKLCGEQKYIEEKTTSEIKITGNVKATSSSTLLDLATFVNKALTEEEKENEIDLTKIGPVKILGNDIFGVYFSAQVKIEVPIEGTIELEGSYKHKTVKGTKIIFNDDGSFEALDISDLGTQNTNELTGKIKAKGSIEPSIGVEMEVGIGYIPDPDVLSIGIKTEPKLVLEIKAELELDATTTGVECKINGLIQLRGECPFSVFLRLPRISVIEHNWKEEKKVHDYTVTFVNYKRILYTHGSEDVVRDIASVDFILLKNGIKVSKINTICYNINTPTFDKEGDSKDFTNLRVFVYSKADHKYVECFAEQLKDSSLYLYEFDSKEEYDIKFEYTPAAFDTFTYEEKSVCYGFYSEVRFDCNYGEIANDIESIVFEANIGLKNLPIPLKNGYIFEGWYDNEKFAGNKYESIEPTEDGKNIEITLYAKWKPDHFTVTYEYTEGKKVIENVEYLSKIIPLNIQDTDLNPNHYTFKGWYRDSNYMVPFDFEHTEINQNTTIYAKLEPVEWTVSFDTGGNGIISSQKVKYGERIVCPDNPEREGYEFFCWCSDEKCLNYFSIYNNYHIDSDITLYACWKTSKCTLTFMCFNSVYEKMKVNYGTTFSKIDIKGNLNTKTLEGYEDFVFDGWYSDASFRTPLNINETITKDTPIYAKLTSKQNYCTVQFFSNQTIKIEPVSVAKGTKFSDIKPNISSPSLEVENWYFDADLTKLISDNYIINSDIILFPKWKQKTVKVTFQYKDTSGKEISQENKAYYGEKVTPYTKYKQITGYKFMGWYTNIKCEDIYKFDFSTKVYSDTVLYGYYEPINCSVRFYDDERMEEVVGKYDGTISLISPDGKKGYSFVGWYIENTNEPFTEETVLKADVNCVARWERNLYSIKLINNGQEKTLSAYYEDKCDLVDPEKRIGYKFVGWKDKNGNTYYSSIGSVESDMVLTANWVETKCTVTCSIPGENEKTYKVDYGASFDGTATKTGHTFEGWHYNETYTSPYTGIAIYGDVKLYAKFSKNQYEVKFFDGDKMDYRNVLYGETCDLPVPTRRTGYKFNGWKISGTNTYLTETTPVEDNYRCVADWADAMSTVTYVIPGGNETYSVPYGADARKSRPKEGYNFEGWYLDDKYTKRYYGEPIEEDAFTLYGKYTIITFTVKYYNNGNLVKTETINYGCTANFPTVSADPKLEFVGWYYDHGNETKLNSSDSIYEDLELNAKWRIKTYTIEYYVDGVKVKTSIREYGSKETAYSHGSDYSVWYMDSDYTTQFNFNTEIKKNYKLYCYNTKIKLTLYPCNDDPISYFTITVGDTYASLPTPNLEFHYLEGWYTAQTGGTKVKSTDVVKLGDCTSLYAHWELNPVSDWILEGYEPTGSEIVQVEYRYNLRTNYETSYLPTGVKNYTEYMKTTSESYVYYIDGWPSGYNSDDQYRKSMRVGAYQNQYDDDGEITYQNLGLNRYIVYNWLYYPYTETWILPTNTGSGIWGSYLTNDTSAVESKYKTISGVDAYYTTVGVELKTSRIAFIIPVYRQKKTVKQRYYRYTIDSEQKTSSSYPKESNAIHIMKWVKYRPR